MTWDAARKRLSLTDDSATVSYRRSDGLNATVIGYGPNYRSRIAHADAQLPPGTWTRQCVSTPMSILADLRGRGDPYASRPQERLGLLAAFEGKQVVIEPLSAA